MAIERKFTQAAENLQEGEHVVKISDIKFGKSKAGDPMWTLTFADKEGKIIKGYYVTTLAFHMSAIKEIKAACGMDVACTPDQLMGKELGIAIEPGKPDKDTGLVFMRIVGYGKAANVETAKQSALPLPEKKVVEEPNEIPF